MPEEEEDFIRCLLKQPLDVDSVRRFKSVLKPYRPFVINVNHPAVNVPPDQNRVKAVGRPTVYGNDFTHLSIRTLANHRVATRDEAVVRCAQLLVWKLRKSPALFEQVREDLRGYWLKCYCYPDFCHAEIYAYLANSGCTLEEFIAIVPGFTNQV